MASRSTRQRQRRLATPRIRRTTRDRPRVIAAQTALGHNVFVMLTLLLIPLQLKVQHSNHFEVTLTLYLDLYRFLFKIIIRIFILSHFFGCDREITRK